MSVCIFVFADESPVLAGHHASDDAKADISLCVCVWNLLYLLVIMRAMVQQLTSLCVCVCVWNLLCLLVLMRVMVQQPCLLLESPVFAGHHASDGATANVSLCVCVCR